MEPMLKTPGASKRLRGGHSKKISFRFREPVCIVGFVSGDPVLWQRS